jgi:hypothetical protein
MTFTNPGRGGGDVLRASAPRNAVSRRHLIQYISNKMGGVHWDSIRTGSKPKDAAFAALDLLSGSANLAGKDPVYFELLAIGQSLVRAPQIASLLAI